MNFCCCEMKNKDEVVVQPSIIGSEDFSFQSKNVFLVSLLYFQVTSLDLIPFEIKLFYKRQLVVCDSV